MRGNVGDEGPNPVNNDPGNPDALQPVPRLIDLVLVVGDFRPDDSHSGHKARQNSADAYNLGVHIYDEIVGDGPHIIDGESGLRHQGHRQRQHQQAGQGALEFVHSHSSLRCGGAGPRVVSIINGTADRPGDFCVVCRV